MEDELSYIGETHIVFTVEPVTVWGRILWFLVGSFTWKNPVGGYLSYGGEEREIIACYRTRKTIELIVDHPFSKKPEEGDEVTFRKAKRSGK